MSDDELAAIAARADAATQGPWVAWGGTRTFGINGGNPDKLPYQWYRIVGCDLDCYSASQSGVLNDPMPGVMNYADGQFIAHARQDVPNLVADVRRLRMHLTEAQGALAEVAIADDLTEAARRKKAKFHYDRIEAGEPWPPV